jgi:hypothetical protein
VNVREHVLLVPSTIRVTVSVYGAIVEHLDELIGPGEPLGPVHA